ncbi:MAG: ArsB/NhaD family transporter, partial [Clostridia bacterium]
VLAVFGVTIALMIVAILFFPSFKIKNFPINTFWIVALVGAIVLLACQGITFKEVGAGLTSKSEINPLKILTLFLSMTALSIFLDEVGFFSYIASLALKKSQGSQTKLFVTLYAMVSFLTIFTSNDIIILTFTPFICYFAKNAKINPTPFLVAEFVGANTWSMMFIIGNPTNIYLATASGINFLEYFKVMALPTLFAGVVSFGMLYLLFFRQLKTPIQRVEEKPTITNKPLIIVGLVHLILCTILLVVSSYIGLEMWLIALVFAVSLMICVLIFNAVKRQKPVIAFHTVARLPWELVPFVISMFVFVLALNKCGVTSILNKAFGTTFTTLKYGFGSLLCANIINNIPMSVLFSQIADGLQGATLSRAIYASIAGSNIGAFLTPLGALAGIMWLGILKKNEIKFSFFDFVKYGCVIAIPTFFACLGGIEIAMLF